MHAILYEEKLRMLLQWILHSTEGQYWNNLKNPEKTFQYGLCTLDLLYKFLCSVFFQAALNM